MEGKKERSNSAKNHVYIKLVTRKQKLKTT